MSYFNSVLICQRAARRAACSTWHRARRNKGLLPSDRPKGHLWFAQAAAAEPNPAWEIYEKKQEQTGFGCWNSLNEQQIGMGQRSCGAVTFNSLRQRWKTSEPRVWSNLGRTRLIWTGGGNEGSMGDMVEVGGGANTNCRGWADRLDLKWAANRVAG